MQPRTRRLLIGATIALLAVACATGFAAAKASAAAHKTKVHKISACGVTISKAGTYELTKNITNPSSTSCIFIQANDVTLYLDGHTITGEGSDTCIDIEGGPKPGYVTYVNQTVISGTMKKPTKSATLTGCYEGLYLYNVANVVASHLNIVAPTGYGVYEDEAGMMNFSNINVTTKANTAYGFYLSYGMNNVVTKSMVDDNSSDEAFYIYYELGDTFTSDSAKDTYSNSGASGYGFDDYYSGKTTFSHDSSKGHSYGFYVYSDGYGPVTITHCYASGPATSGTYGYYVYEADQEADSGSPYHTSLSHNKADGFDYGFWDETDTSYYSVSEKWIDNTADNYLDYGFDIYYGSDYTFTGNVADANTSGKKYNGGSQYGFYFYDPYSYYPFKTFSDNQAYDNYYGFYSDEYFLAGKGNIAKRNEYNAYLVQIEG